MTQMSDLISRATSQSEYSNLLESDRFGIVSVVSYEAVGDGVTDDTNAIQDAIDVAVTNGSGYITFPPGNDTYICQDLSFSGSNITIDLGGNTLSQTSGTSYLIYLSGAGTQKNITIKNGKLTSNGIGKIIYAYDVDDITIENIEIDGQDATEKGIFIWQGNNIIVKNCTVYNMITSTDITVGVYLKTCTFSRIDNCTIYDIVGVANGVVGDAEGAARGVLLEKCSNTSVIDSYIYNIESTEDGDGIQVIGDDYSLTEIETNAFILIKNNKFNNCDKRSIKLQQSGIIVDGNELTSTSTQEYGVTFYASNIKFINNSIKVDTSTPTMIGSSIVDIIKNIVIENNHIEYSGTSFQACIQLNTTQLIENVLIKGNTLIGDDGLTEEGVYIRTYFKNIRIIGNKMTQVVRGVYVRDISGITPIPTSVRENLIIIGNDVVAKYNLLHEEATNITTGIVVSNNIIEISDPLSYAENSVRMTPIQFNEYTYVGNNIVINSGFTDGDFYKSSLGFRAKFEIFDDFNYQTLTEADTPWILEKGTDPQSLDPAISNDERGKIVLTTGDNSGALADDGSLIVCSIPVQADSGGLVVETRLHINSAITGISVNFGLTDTTALEEPFTIAGTTITSNATDAACFVYDDGATTKQWYACAVDTDTDDTGNATTGTAPVANTYQKLRIEVSSDGNSIYFFINDSHVKTLTNAGITPNVNLYAVIVANSTAAASKTVDVDYIYIAHNR